ncbi:MAG: endonuclease/exonuclease/phosphatase family protein [Sedimentisphaerales bacterium]|nr:endonuclease/exonuclease/phosphatase family protein [Sedimentisphaerales bacterium]
MSKFRACFLLLLIALPAANSSAETIKVATYNIELFSDMFDQHKLPSSQRNRTEYFRDCEDIYEVARVITLPQFSPDILCIQEAPDQEALELFNKEYLKGYYQFVQVFKGNSTSRQHLAMMAKTGFKAESVDEYYKDKDPADSNNKKLLFSRGPAFVTFITPANNRIIIGLTHIKSKAGDNAPMVLRRTRQIARIREICENYIETKPYVAVLGDFNDSFGKDNNEIKANTDALAEALAGKVLLRSLTKPLQEQGQYSYHCQLKPIRYRSFLDHIFVSIPLFQTTQNTTIITDPIADVASDHWPVMATFELPEEN